jgi:O-antigen ligase
MNVTEILATTLGIVVLGPILLIVFVRSFAEPKVAMAIGLVLTLLSLSSFGMPELRYALFLVLIPHISSAVKKTKIGSQYNYPSFMVPLLYVIVCFVSVVWSLNPSKTFVSGAAWLILLLYVFTFRTLLSPESIRRIVFFILLGFLVLSLFYLATPDGWAGGRARGIFNNANSTGIYTFLLLGVSLFMGRKYWIWLFPIGLGLIFATGSRATLLAVIVLIAINIVFWIDRKFRLTAVVFVFAISVYPIRWIWNWVQQLDAEGDSMLRTNDSRASTWEVAFAFIRENPLLGAGYGATPPVIGSSSYIKLVAEFGFLFSIFGLLVAGAYLLWSRYDPVLLGITLGVLINTIFEDWLLTAGAPMLAVYLLLVMSTHQPNGTADLNSRAKDSKLRSSGEVSSTRAVNFGGTLG